MGCLPGAVAFWSEQDGGAATTSQYSLSVKRAGGIEMSLAARIVLARDQGLAQNHAEAAQKNSVTTFSELTPRLQLIVSREAISNDEH